MVFAPDRERAEVVLFWMTPLTLAPSTALIRTDPAPVPALVIVPELLTDVVERVMPVPLELLALSVRLPAPVTPPLKVVDPVVPVEVTLSTGVPDAAAKVIGPLKIAAAVTMAVALLTVAAGRAPLLPMVIVPAPTPTTLMGFETVKVLASKLAELTLAVASPRVTGLLPALVRPKAPETVVALLTLATAVPLLMVTPPVAVLTPVKVATPVKPEPRTTPPPAVAPEIAPVWVKLPLPSRVRTLGPPSTSVLPLFSRVAAPLVELVIVKVELPVSVMAPVVS